MLNHYLLFRDLRCIRRAPCQSWFKTPYNNCSGEIRLTCLKTEDADALCTHIHIRATLQLRIILWQQMWKADWQAVNPLVDRCSRTLGAGGRRGGQLYRNVCSLTAQEGCCMWPLLLWLIILVEIIDCHSGHSLVTCVINIDKIRTL